MAKERAIGRLLAGLLARRIAPGELAPPVATAVIRAARRGKLASTLAQRLPDSAMARLLLASDSRAALHRKRLAWDVGKLVEDLAPLGCPVVLLKGAAYAAQPTSAAEGRMTGDVDIMVPRSWLGAAEQQLLDRGWQWLKSDPYDDAYYRQWMHELPPLQHPERALLLDLHHTILPLTARIRPDAARLFARARPSTIPGALVLALPDQLIHSALHLFYDGDLDGGLRNLWDIACLLRDGAADPGFDADLAAEIAHQNCARWLFYALRYAGRLFDAPVGPLAQNAVNRGRPNMLLLAMMDWLVLARLDDADWLRPTLAGRIVRFALYVRSHWLRMPPLMLARHLATKALKRFGQRAA